MNWFSFSKSIKWNCFSSFFDYVQIFRHFQNIRRKLADFLCHTSTDSRQWHTFFQQFVSLFMKVSVVSPFSVTYHSFEKPCVPFSAFCRTTNESSCWVVMTQKLRAIRTGFNLRLSNFEHPSKTSAFKLPKRSEFHFHVFCSSSLIVFSKLQQRTINNSLCCCPKPIC